MVMSDKLPELPVQQLFILSLCRLADPISFSSVFPYLPEMIESFNVPKNKVGRWAGLTSAVFSLSQAVTGIFWGRAADRFGRKPVILAGMVCVMSSGLLFGFSQNLAMAIMARSFAGASNGNVGILRTTVAELVPQRELQPRAFSVMPLMWTIGSIFGPVFGGALANPASRYPKLFGTPFFEKFPYALPNLAASLFFLVGLIAGSLFLKETLESKKYRRDYGRVLGKAIVRAFGKKAKGRHAFTDNEQSASLLKHRRISSVSTMDDDDNFQPAQKPVRQEAPSYREVFSKQSNINLLTYTLLALHSVAYDQLLPVFMHHPSQSNRPSDPGVHLPLQFSGGFGIDSDRIGILFTIYGVAGTIIQFVIFPPLARYYGVLDSLKVVTIVFPLVYLVTPFTALISNPLTQQIVMFLIMLIKGFASIFAFPCTTILMNNSAVSMRILGTLNGVATSVSAIGRATGPAVAGAMFEVGAVKGWAILPWWVLAAFAVLGAIPVWWLVEMEGFGGPGSASDAEDDEAEGPKVAHSEQGGGGSRPMAIGSPEAIPGGGEEETDGFALEDEGLLSTGDGLSRTVSKSSSAAVGMPLRRVSSPIGLRTSPGPGGNRLSNGLGYSRSGFGAGGTSYH